MSNGFSPKVFIARKLVIFSIAMLVILSTLTTVILPPNAPNVTAWLVRILPLLLFVPGLLAGRLRSYQWLCFLIQIYFIGGVLRAFSPGGLLWGVGEIIFCIVLFTSAIVFVNGCRGLQKQP